MLLLPLTIISITLIYSLLFVFLPGFFLYIISASRLKLIKIMPVNVILISFTCGFIYNYLLFLAGLLFSFFHIISSHGSFLFFKLIFDVFVLFFGVTFFKREAQHVVKKIIDFYKANRFYVLFLIFSFIFGIIVYLIYPYVRNCQQLVWTEYFVRNNIKNFGFDVFFGVWPWHEGSLGFSALCYFPRIVFGFPIISIAAGYKVLFCFLIALAVIYIVEKIPLRYKKISAFTYYVLIMFSNYGIIGTAVAGLEKGKTSTYAALYIVLFVISLIDFEKAKRFNSNIFYEPLLFAFTAAAFGIISIPYIPVLLLIYYFFTIKKKDFLIFTRKLIVFFAIPVIVTVSTIFYESFYHVVPYDDVYIKVFFSILLFAVGLVLFWLCLGVFINKNRNNCLRNYRKFFLYLLLFLISFLIIKMPANGPFLHYVDPAAFTILDGKTTLYSLIFNYSHLSFLLILISLLGIFLLGFNGNYYSVSLVSLALFPWIIYFVGILAVSFFNVPEFAYVFFRNLIKDIPRYFDPFIYILFAIIVMDRISMFFREKTRNAFFIVMCVAMVAITIGADREFVMNFRPAYFNSVIGSGDKYYADLVESLFVFAENNKTYSQLEFIISKNNYFARDIYSPRQIDVYLVKDVRIANIAAVNWEKYIYSKGTGVLVLCEKSLIENTMKNSDKIVFMKINEFKYDKNVDCLGVLLPR